MFEVSIHARLLEPMDHTISRTPRQHVRSHCQSTFPRTLRARMRSLRVAPHPSKRSAPAPTLARAPASAPAPAPASAHAPALAPSRADAPAPDRARAPAPPPARASPPAAASSSLGSIAAPSRAGGLPAARPLARASAPAPSPSPTPAPAPSPASDRARPRYGGALLRPSPPSPAPTPAPSLGDRKAGRPANDKRVLTDRRGRSGTPASHPSRPPPWTSWHRSRRT